MSVFKRLMKVQELLKVTGSSDLYMYLPIMNMVKMMEMTMRLVKGKGQCMM